MAVHLAKRLLTIDDYHRMAEAKILSEEEKIELLNGEIITMSPVGSEHTACVKRLNALFNRLLGEKVIVSVQDPVQLPPLSEPEPDIALLHFREDYYASSHPTAQNIHLIIEVASSSLLKDREVKRTLYAEARVPEYWIINLEEDQVELYRDPENSEYQSMAIAKASDTVRFSAFDMDLEASALLPLKVQ